MSFDSSPVDHSEPVTPSDTVGFKLARGLWVGTPGDVSVVERNGSTALYKGVPSGMLGVYCTRVNATGTTAEDLRALY